MNSVQKIQLEREAGMVPGDPFEGQPVNLFVFLRIGMGAAVEESNRHALKGALAIAHFPGKTDFSLHAAYAARPPLTVCIGTDDPIKCPRCSKPFDRSRDWLRHFVFDGCGMPKPSFSTEP